MDRAAFLALLARLNGDGEGLTSEELSSVMAYIAANRGDAEAVTDAELAEVDTACRAIAEDDEADLPLLAAAVALAEETWTATAEREVAAEEAAAVAETQAAEAAALRERLRNPEANAEGDGTADGDGGTGEDTGDGAGDGTGDGTADGDGGTGEEEQVSAGVTAGGGRRSTAGARRQMHPSGGGQVPDPRRRAQILRDGEGEFANLAEVSAAMLDRRRRMISFNGPGREQVVVAAIHGVYDDAHTLGTDMAVNEERVNALTLPGRNIEADELDMLAAAGGLCGPAEPFYGLQRLGDQDRPFAASLERLHMGRSKLTYRTSPSFVPFAGAVSQWTVADDVEAVDDPDVRKPCLRVECLPEQTVELYAVTSCLTIGNFMDRSDPETVRNAGENTATQFAMLGDTLLLDAVKAGSKQVTSGQTLGAYRDLVYAIGVAAARFRSYWRMSDSAVLEVRLPSWVRALMREDIARSLPAYADQLAVADEVITKSFTVRGVRVAAWYKDSPTTGTSQVFPAQPTGSAMIDFPSEVQWHLTHPGAWLLGENGRLDLGVVRDRDLVLANDYMTFMETFEGPLFMGLESLWYTTTVCPNGASSGTIAPDDFCAGPYVPA